MWKYLEWHSRSSILHAICHNKSEIFVEFCFCERSVFCLDECQMTVMGRIILRFFYKVWFFGAIYFCLSWLFLLVRIPRNSLIDCRSSLLSRSSWPVQSSFSVVNVNRIFKNTPPIIYSNTKKKMNH